MKRTVTQYYCDVCGNECDQTEYILPVVKEEVYKIGYIMRGNVKPEKQNLCDRCAGKIAYLSNRVAPLIEDNASQLYPIMANNKAIMITGCKFKSE